MSRPPITLEPMIEVAYPGELSTRCYGCASDHDLRDIVIGHKSPPNSTRVTLCHSCRAALYGELAPSL